MARGLSRRGLGTAFALGMLAALACCAAVAPAPQHIDITLIGFNDLHGHLEPPRLVVRVPGPDGAVAVPAGGAAYLASAIAALKASNPHHGVVSAGDMVGASPLVSALFLDEPTIEAVNPHADRLQRRGQPRV